MTETSGPLLCAISWLQVSVLLPQYLLQLQFLDSCVGCSLERFQDGLQFFSLPLGHCSAGHHLQDNLLCKNIKLYP